MLMDKEITKALVRDIIKSIIFFWRNKNNGNNKR